MTNGLDISFRFEKPYIDSTSMRESENSLLIELLPEEEIRNEKFTVKGIDFCVVLDVSTSMSEAFEENGSVSKLDAAVTAVKKLYKFLKPDDTLSLILYHTLPITILSFAKDIDENDFYNAVDKAYRESGSTNISEALKSARSLLLSRNTGNLKKIIFLTDGQPVDDTEEDGIIEGREIGERKISITALGIGYDFNMDFIEKLVKPSRGTIDWLQNPDDSVQIFEDTLKRTQAIVVNNVELELQVSDEVRVKDFYRAMPEITYFGKMELTGNRLYKINLEDIEMNKKYRYLFEITIPNQVQNYEGIKNIIKAKLRYTLPSTGYTTEKELNIDIEFTTDSDKADRIYSTVTDNVNKCHIKKLDGELNTAYKQQDTKLIISTINKLIEKSKESGEDEAAENYENILAEFGRTNNIAPEKLIAATNTSTKINGDGTIEEEIPENQDSEIFGFN